MPDALLRMRHIALKRISVGKSSLKKTEPEKKIRTCRHQVKKHIVFSCVEHVVASLSFKIVKKQIADLKGPRQFAQDIRKDPMMIKKTISVTESLSELSSMAKLTKGFRQSISIT